MIREQARQMIRACVPCEKYLTKSKGANMYNCPFCKSGTGKNQTGALKLYPTNTWTCHVCHKSGDVIDLYMKAHNVGFNEAFSLLADEVGITVDPYNPSQNAIECNHREEKNTPINEKRPREQPQTFAPDNTAYYYECRRRIDDPAAAAYLKKRGISQVTAEAYWIGFDPEADPASAPGGNGAKRHPTPRIIIPTSPQHYIARRIDGDTNYRVMNPAGAKPGIFGAGALFTQEAQEVFVCEGAFDALSILEMGYSAVALNSAGNWKILVEKLEETGTNATLILCPDNDADPQTAARIKKEFDDFAAELQRLNISHVMGNINCGHKDANEALCADREAFGTALENARSRTAAKPDNLSHYISTLMRGEIDRFKEVKFTGFKNLDDKSGGLYPGLYTVGAISSLGKTTFCHQIADQLAAAGHDVIFFSLEQSRLELVSKSLARKIARTDHNSTITSLSIRRGYIPPKVEQAAKEYQEEVGDRISVVEGNFECNISFIGKYIRDYIKRTGTRPVVFIDYLQILQPETVNGRQQAIRETVDTSITTLKRISRELDLTVFVICSVNRSNYLTPIDFESLKESGGIEYTSDVIWGLQLQCINEDIFGSEKKDIKKKRERVKEAKAETPRKIELCCLKNRYGIASYTVNFDYFPAVDLFEESSSNKLDMFANRFKNAEII